MIKINDYEVKQGDRVQYISEISGLKYTGAAERQIPSDGRWLVNFDSEEQKGKIQDFKLFEQKGENLLTLQDRIDDRAARMKKEFIEDVERWHEVNLYELMDSEVSARLQYWLEDTFKPRGMRELKIIKIYPDYEMRGYHVSIACEMFGGDVIFLQTKPEDRTGNFT